MTRTFDELTIDDATCRVAVEEKLKPTFDKIITALGVTATLGNITEIEYDDDCAYVAFEYESEHDIVSLMQGVLDDNGDPL